MIDAWSLRRELLIALLVLAISAVCLPGMIYAVGGMLFGVYDEGLVGMYRATFTDLRTPRLAAWVLLATPTLSVVLLRVLFRLTSKAPIAEQSTAAQTQRREPTLGG